MINLLKSQIIKSDGCSVLKFLGSFFPTPLARLLVPLSGIQRQLCPGRVGPRTALLCAPSGGSSGAFLLCFSSAPRWKQTAFLAPMAVSPLDTQWGFGSGACACCRRLKKDLRGERHNTRGPLLQAEISSCPFHIINVQLCVLKLHGDSWEGTGIYWIDLNAGC